MGGYKQAVRQRMRRIHDGSMTVVQRHPPLGASRPVQTPLSPRAVVLYVLALCPPGGKALPFPRTPYPPGP